MSLNKNYHPSASTSSHKKESGIGIAALICSLLGCTLIFGIILSIIDLIKNDKSKKHITAKIALVISAIWILAMALAFADTSSGDSNDSAITEPTVDIAQTISEESEVSFKEEASDTFSSSEEMVDQSVCETSSISQHDEASESTPSALPSGVYDLQGISVTYSDYVRNDKTGNWKISKVATDSSITDFALDYYNTFFSTDDEIHAIINFTLNTTSKLSMITSDLMDITVMEYVSKEEHDADLLFSGAFLKEYHLTISTGEIEEIQ